jgi:hypothetical protein
MPRTKPRPEALRRKERVKAAVDLRDVPEGTEGRVMLSNGIGWTRYWVSFDNGVDMGSLGREKLVRVDEWKQYLLDRERQVDASVDARDEAGTESAGAEAAGGVTVNGVAVPQLLLDRTKAALERLGVSR